ncbi:MAG: histidine phosphatase family protein [Pseudomonadota bacterium]|nr:histidine phosphatase family protein [Pseudomonadota bacterium]
MSLLLIRHGETAFNRDRVMQPADTPLSEQGMAQARQLAGRLRGAGIRRILASELARARMTAEPIAEAAGVEIEFDPLLHERNFGVLRGQRFVDLEVQGIEPFVEDYVPPEGESWEVFDTRVSRAWAVIRAAVPDDGDLAVVTHGLVCAALLRNHLDLSDHETQIGRLYPLRNASLTRIEPLPPWRVELLNSTVHLDNSDAKTPIYGQA